MPEKQWTQSQSYAINARNGSLLVSAAAGSGKTAVLVERVIQRITDPVAPVDADRLLVVTFTRAAAAEMKERISVKIDELIAQDPMNSALRRQQLLLSKAHISTIHSFCSDLVRENFFELNISPDFRLADENELSLLKTETVNHVIESLYDDASQDFFTFADYFSTAKSDYLLVQVILKLHEFLCAHPFPEKWLLEKEAMYKSTLPVEETQWGSVIIEYTKNAAEFCLQLTRASIDIFDSHGELGDGLLSLLTLDLNYTEKLFTVISEKSWDEIRGFLNSFHFSARFVSAKGFKDDPQKLAIQANRDVLKNILKSLCSLFEQSEDDCRDDINHLSTLVHQLFLAVRRFSEEYALCKQEKNIADFNDLEHLTLNLLIKEQEDDFAFTPQAEAASKNFQEVMVDEYQDANEIQDLIFRAVSTNGKNLFVVGDVKQSIYGFRQAMPEIFLRRKDSCAVYNPEYACSPAKIILDKNFRSRRGVTDAVNFIFRRLMSPSCGDITYSAEEELTAGARYDESDTPDMVFHLLDASDPQEIDTDQLEARHIAKLIKTYLLTHHVTENGEKRKANLNDFCILLRSASTHANVFVSELKNCGIPASSETSGSFLTSQEITVMMSYLRVIDNPLLDIPLLNVLMSPIYGFTPDDLAEMRIQKPDGKLYFALKQYADSGNKNAAAFLSDLKQCRSLSATLPTDILINTIYMHTGYTALVQSVSNGEIMLNNLHLLQEYAKNYEQSGYKGLSGFVRLIDKLQEQNCDLKSIGGRSEQTESVKVMSIHHSKGLEFPFCFLAATARSFRSDKNEEVLLHGELGIGIRRKDTQNMCRYSTMPRQAVALEIEREGKSEELRVLYVAMTRAREKLIVLSSQKNPQRYLQAMASKLTAENTVLPYIVRSASCISNWITQCALTHPDGYKLRELAGMPSHVLCEECQPWEIKVIETAGEADNKPVQSETVNKQSQEDQSVDITAFVNKITARYPYEALRTIPVKVAASEVAHNQSDDSFAFSARPAFMKKESMTAAQRGTALHAFMQYANLSVCTHSPDKELKRLVSTGFLSQQQAEVTDLDKVDTCLKSDIMRRFVMSEKQYREFRFTVKIKAGLANKELKPPYDMEDIILQGAVDCAFEENGEIVIVDYKTDKITNVSELKERYAVQLALYRKAMEQCTGKRVKECVLYSFCLDQTISV